MNLRFFLPCFHGLRASRLGHKRKEKPRSIIAVRTSHSANKRLVLYVLWTNLQNIVFLRIDACYKSLKSFWRCAFSLWT